MMKHRLKLLDFALATTPTSGERMINQYWVVDHKCALAFMVNDGWRSVVPQCADDKADAQFLAARIHHGRLRVRKIPVVYLGHAESLRARPYRPEDS